MSNLAKQIEILNKELSKQLPDEINELFAQSIKDLKDQKIEEKAMTVGMSLPPFSLMNSESQKIDSQQLLGQYDKVVLFFFRGSWCPYCNLELRAIQELLVNNQLDRVGILAISPQLTTYSKQLIAENNLAFELLFDQNNELAKKLGIAFTLQDYAQVAYSGLGIDLSSFNGNNSNELPIPAVFVVDKNAIITYSFVDSNYTSRIDIDLLLKQL
ncbi:peroxiredoxin-like family protein [Flavobacterium sp. NKUCC04_CG]|uniref:peroxiredoxin-like family protein n=1 Tax=Flavobacterium sp. NKUCC04_CG TaxID=2842121 RepID=UPI001C5A7E6C|nr:peroxiredoxin-like family protein [Flavobacterium sp. NKUCC04_CG]MBW3519156.1 AhpC/TSA family protein [Flavobacterium sp. NKUCC04_CG]